MSLQNEVKVIILMLKDYIVPMFFEHCDKAEMDDVKVIAEDSCKQSSNQSDNIAIVQSAQVYFNTFN